MASLEFRTDREATAEVIKATGTMMRDQRFSNYDEYWWNPDKIDEILEEYAHDEECVVGTVEGEPVVAAIVQPDDHHSLDDYWGETHESGLVVPKPALYMYYISVDREAKARHPELKGVRLSHLAIGHTIELAADSGLAVVRLDAKQEDVRRTYEERGLEVVHTVGESGLYEISVNSQHGKS